MAAARRPELLRTAVCVDILELPVPLGAQLAVCADCCVCSAARLLVFQSNLNLLRDMAVLVARDFKSRPARSRLFVFHRYGALQGKGPSGISHVLGQLHLSDSYSGLFLKEEYK